MREVLSITPGQDGGEDILRRLLKLWYQEDEIENIKEVTISRRVDFAYDDYYEEVPFTENMVSDIIRTFQHISSKGIVWDMLYLKGCDQEDPQFQSLLSQICKLELFREIALHDERGELTERTAKYFSDAMENNTKLEKISLRYTSISPIVSSVLCQGLKTENRNLTELSFYAVNFGEASSDQPSAADAVSHLVTGLQNNKTLKIFSFDSLIVSDRGDSRIIKALEGHPTLEHLELSVCSRGQVNKNLESLRGLLSLQSCKVCSLKLTGVDTGKVIDLDLLLEGLEQSKSLKRLSLSDCDLDDGDLSILLRNLWIIQNLTHLDLSGNLVRKLPVLDTSVLVKFRQSRLRSLNLDSNPIMWESKKEDQLSLLQLVMNMPLLGYIARPLTTETSNLITPFIRHYLDWNRFGRVLTTDHEKSLPLSMWPLVFARANMISQEDRKDGDQLTKRVVPRDSPDRRPNVIYQLFHGFVYLHSRVLSMGIESYVDSNDAAEPKEKRRRLI